MHQWVSDLGYIGVFIGTFFEGETTILIAGIFAKLGYLQLTDVIICAFLGTFLGDCTFFFLGKLFGQSIIGRYEFLRNKRALSDRIILQHGNLILYVMRFLAGFRSIILLLLGCSHLSTTRFLLLDIVSCMVWSTLISLVGYSFANVVYIFVSDARTYERIIVPLAIVVTIAGILFYRHFIKEKEEEQFDGDRREATPGTDKKV
jgi:membrane protein DedA with SNARE-associated domain